jgi:hypothetical protein
MTIGYIGMDEHDGALVCHGLRRLGSLRSSLHGDTRWLRASWINEGFSDQEFQFDFTMVLFHERRRTLLLRNSTLPVCLPTGLQRHSSCTQQNGICIL